MAMSDEDKPSPRYELPCAANNFCSVFNFVCPICGWKSYRRVTIVRPDGSTRETSLFECGMCSVIFLRPQLFSKNR